MGTYTPLDLNALYNAGLDILGGQGPLGAQSFRGLPFVLGSDAGRCLIACSGERSGVEIPVGRRATWMIVAASPVGIADRRQWAASDGGG